MGSTLVPIRATLGPIPSVDKTGAPQRSVSTPLICIFPMSQSAVRKDPTSLCM